MSQQPQSAHEDMASADVATLVAAWARSIHDFRNLVAPLDEESWALPTACPGWSVGDVVAHIVGIERELAGDSLPTHVPDYDSLPHVGESPFSRYTEVAVDARRGQPRADTLAELDEVIARRVGQLGMLDDDLAAEVPGPAGRPLPLERVLRMRTFDLWVHEQDVRAAIEQPGNLATPGALVSAQTIVSAQPFVFGKKVGAPAGSSLQLVVGGDVPLDLTLRVGDDGRADFVSTLAGAPGDSDGPTTRIDTDWETFMLLGCGRVGPQSARVVECVTVEGDRALGLRYLANAAFAP